jgi:hypothetical protein
MCTVQSRAPYYYTIFPIGVLVHEFSYSVGQGRRPLHLLLVLRVLVLLLLVPLGT